MTSASWHTLRQNRIATAHAQGFAYCEYRGLINQRREPSWNKLDAIYHTLFNMNFTSVFWIDVDAFFAFPQQSILQRFGATKCALSFDVASWSTSTVNAGVGFLRRCDQTRDFLETMLDQGYRVAKSDTKTYPWYFWDQNAFRWYIDKHPELFERVDMIPDEEVFCRVFKFGDMQVFPTSISDVKSGPTAFVRHFAGNRTQDVFGDKIMLTAHALNHWLKHNLHDALQTKKYTDVRCLSKDVLKRIGLELEKISANAASVSGRSVTTMFINNGHIAEVPNEINDFAAAALMPGIDTICEVGFNAGHSAAVFLMANPTAKYITFDLGELSWSVGQVEYISKMFPNRVTYVKGDSHTAIARYQNEHPETKCDLWSIDGDHGPNSRLDFEAARNMASPHGLVLADDCTQSFPAVKEVWRQLQILDQVKNLYCHNEDRMYGGYHKGWCLGSWLISVSDKQDVLTHSNQLTTYMKLRDGVC